ncbi:MAG: hypothetical protein HXS52_00640 [Theionarchaea archaeon]|nr:hypothetical protein [Theionarchaea archaeon]
MVLHNFFSRNKKMIVELVAVVVVYGVMVVVLVRRRKEPKTNQPGKTQKDGIFSDLSFLS